MIKTNSLNILIYHSLLLLILFLPRESFAVSESATFDRELFYILPHGRTTGSILENWLTPVVFHQVETGGLSRVDLPRFSSRGISWIEQNYNINGIDITDPFNSGYPLFEPAWDTITGIKLKSFRENDPYKIGLNWNVAFPDYISPYQISNNLILPTGRGSPIPERLLDREPAHLYGAPKKRRRYRFSNETNAALNNSKKYYIGVETLFTQREFHTLIDQNGEYKIEEAEKYTLTILQGNDSISIPYKILFLTQYNENNNYGANLRLDNTKTLDQKNIIFHLQLNAGKEDTSEKIHIKSGITGKFEKLNSHITSPSVIEFDSESGPAPLKGDINRINFDNSLSSKYNIFKFEAAFQMNRIVFKPDIPFLQTMTAEEGSVFHVTLWDKPETCKEDIYNSRLKSGFSKTWNGLSLSGNIYVDNSHARANGSRILNWYGIGGKILSRFDLKKTKTAFSFCGLHQPARINSYITSFLNTKRPSGKTYNWSDPNGNEIIDTSEISGLNLVSSTGGKYHHKDSNLKRPYHDEFSVEIEQRIEESLKLIFQASRRIFSNYLIVNYEQYGGTYSSTPEGFMIYHKPSEIDQYYLSNNTGDRGCYDGAGVQLFLEKETYFLKVMFTAFMVRGFAPIGNGPDFNDYAVISEDTASPNSRINASGGRLDSDRAYMIKVLFGWEIRNDLSFGTTLKYRDGESFSQHRVYYDSNGPIRIMNRERGNWDGKGKGRYTFSWNIDIRLRYTPVIWGKNLIATLDIYNILDSSTEIIESYKYEERRISIEAVPDRMFRAGIEMLF